MTDRDDLSRRNIDTNSPSDPPATVKDASNTNVLAPNMFLENFDVRQSTWHYTAFQGSVIAESNLDYSQLLQVNMRQTTFARVTLDHSRLIGCSLRDVVLEACDVSGLVINGVRIGDLFVSYSAPKEEKQ
jgi:uncharacterized protein YjbI with pentapeptide repeats